MRSGGVDESRRNTHKTRRKQRRRVDDKPNKEAPATAGACEKLNKQAPATAGACEKLVKQAPATAGACEKIEKTSAGNRGSLLFMTSTITSASSTYVYPAPFTNIIMAQPTTTRSLPPSKYFTDSPPRFILFRSITLHGFVVTLSSSAHCCLASPPGACLTPKGNLVKHINLLKEQFIYCTVPDHGPAVDSPCVHQLLSLKCGRLLLYAQPKTRCQCRRAQVRTT